MRPWIDALARGLALWGALAGAAAIAAEAPARIPLEHFVRAEAISRVVLSPSGRRLAVLQVGGTGTRQLAIMNLDPLGEARLLAAYADADVDSVRWVDDERIVYEVVEKGGYEVRSGGVSAIAVNVDGSEERRLISWYSPGDAEYKSSAFSSRVLPREWTLAGTANDGSPDVIVYRRTTDAAGDLRDTLLHRLDSRTQALRSISVGMPENTRRWLVDWQSQPRVAVATNKGRTKIHWRASAEAPWQEVAEFELRASDAIDPFFVEDDGRMLVQAVRVGDTEGLYRFDPRTRTLDSEPLVHVKGFDLQGKGEWDFASHRLLGVHLRADRPLSHWFDATMAQLQKSVDAALPAGRNNRLVCGNCETSRFLVIDSRSDRQPGEFFLLDREKMTLQRIGARRPWLREAEQGRRSFHRIMARDGLSFPVYVTHPANARPDQALPAVVLVHGGPWLRGADTNWSEAAQFLASRGYRVIEPEFRGSVGYGDALFRAGWRQWGRAMQDDLADAVRWAGAQGLIDPGRVCISGVGYGGYAALMAPIASPGVYRCAVSFGGITDIGLVFDIGWSQMSREFLTYGAPALIGDPKDREQFDRVSPLRRAAEIKVPVLLGHGLLDPWVPPKQAREFVSAARAAGVPVEVTYYEDEARELRHHGNRADFYQRLERFLDTHLRTPP